jgi:hypothetical protein
LACGLPRSSAIGQASIKACVSGRLGLQPDARSNAICKRSGKRAAGRRAKPPARRSPADAGSVVGACGAAAARRKP